MSLSLLIPKTGIKIKIPMFVESVKAGFPTPAENFTEAKLDLNELLIKHPAATYFVRVSGDSMQDAGISDGDILIVDRALEPKEGKIVIASINNEFTVKRIVKLKGRLYLFAENKKYKPIELKSDDPFQIFGVVSSVIKTL